MRRWHWADTLVLAGYLAEFLTSAVRGLSDRDRPPSVGGLHHLAYWTGNLDVREFSAAEVPEVLLRAVRIFSI